MNQQWLQIEAANENEIERQRISEVEKRGNLNEIQPQPNRKEDEMSTQKVMTIEATAETFSKGIPEWKKRANLDWLRLVHATLKEGGVWGSPALGTVYTKCGDGFIKGEMKC